ncbi:MAG: amino acid ABC transporter substrate-binding protein [Dehalococcoidia bacterium]|nr:amino acid ABC transporter substrate-binding protein [Dehalococcoidia bacterium]
MKRIQAFVLGMGLLAIVFAIVACSQEMSNAEIQSAAQEMGMVTKAEADAMAQGAMMSDDQIMAAAADMGMMTEDEAKSMMGDTMMVSNRLQQVKDRGKVICASRNDVPGYGYLDAGGNNVGFDIDLCRALATAVLGDPNAIEIRLISAAERGPTIQSGEVDMLVRTVTWTTSRDSGWGNYAQTMFYDGQGFMVNKDLGVMSAYDLDGASVCVTQGTTTELNLADFASQNNLDIEAVTFEDTDAVVAAYESGQCDAFTNDRSQLAALGSAMSDPMAHTILPETISEEPLGPVVPHGDDQWFDIVKTVMGILIYGEAYGVSSSNVPSSVTGDTKVDRLMGLEGSFGQESLGISQTAAQDVIKAVGNYGEIYDRNLGPSGINLPRENGRNALWADAPCQDCPKGGQIYAAPLR